MISCRQIVFGLAIGVLFGLFFGACIHDPVIPEDFDPDNPTGQDTTMQDTTSMMDNCNQNVIYFSNDVQPILSSNCAVPSCHDNATASDGVILVDYNSTLTTADVRPGDPLGSDIYEVLLESDPDKKMPPPNSGITITPDQIDIIRKWIDQGALDLECNPFGGGCDTSQVTFNLTIQPLINNNCRGCHSGNTPQASVSLETYAGIKAVADDGRLEMVVTHAPGITPMPFNQPMLPECKVRQILIWIGEGALNN